MSNSYEDFGEKKDKNAEHIFDDMQIVRFGERLEEAMNGESKLSFAKKCGLSDSLIGRYLRGESYPGIDKMPAIASACGKSMSWLITGVEETPRMGEDDANKDDGLANDDLTNWWLMIFQSLTDTEKKKAVSLFQRYGISALLPNIMEDNATASVISREILQQRDSTKKASLAEQENPQNKKAG